MDKPLVVSMKPEAVTWATAIRLFSLRCRSQNLSPRTLELYDWQLALFKDWLIANAATYPADTKPEHLRSYLEARKDQGVSGGTVDIAFRVLRTFWRFLERDGLILINPMTKVERPRRERRLVRPFTEGELRQVLSQMDTKDSLGLRDYTLTLLLADTGLRISEALALKLTDIDWAGQSLVVLGKGRKERRVFFGQAARKVLSLWAARRGDVTPDALVFVNRFGEVLQRGQFQHRLKAYTVGAGIAAKRLSPHALRHFFALQFLRNGGDVITLQRLLGHSSLDMVRNYINMTDDDALAKHRRASPLDHMGVIPGTQSRVVIK